MIPTNSVADAAARRATRLTWIALSVAALAFMVMAVGTAFGLRSPWTSWLLGFLLISNPAVYLLSQKWRAFRAAQVYYRLSLVATLVVLAGVIFRVWHR